MLWSEAANDYTLLSKQDCVRSLASSGQFVLKKTTPGNCSAAGMLSNLTSPLEDSASFLTVVTSDDALSLITNISWFVDRYSPELAHGQVAAFERITNAFTARDIDRCMANFDTPGFMAWTWEEGDQTLPRGQPRGFGDFKNFSQGFFQHFPAAPITLKKYVTAGNWMAARLDYVFTDDQGKPAISEEINIWEFVHAPGDLFPCKTFISYEPIPGTG
eukprot:TRINITY_DN12209_c0_g1_i4.p1 TRINITY_DN12209_c0_g1~~TRINITY_DN12209_c0_g1_i4.p1  ORF type:complete len:217 (+),score=28.54 TRINITY_DN12209_c0_g1_i4:296-946(+)